MLGSLYACSYFVWLPYDLGQGVFDNDSCIATADVVTVFFDTKNKKSQELTDELKRILESAM